MTIIKSNKMPKPNKLINKKMAYNYRVPPISEMRYRSKKYSENYSDYTIDVEKNATGLNIEFRNGKFSEKITIMLGLNGQETYNQAFGEYDYNLSLISVALKSDNDKMSEYLEATYWGTTTEHKSAEEFVVKNARIVQTKFVLKPNYRTNVNTRFVCTDVNAYTKNRKPNPWCRDCMLLIYENNKKASNVRDHPKLGVPKKEFKPTYSTDLVKPSYVY